MLTSKIVSKFYAEYTCMYQRLASDIIIFLKGYFKILEIKPNMDIYYLTNN